MQIKVIATCANHAELWDRSGTERRNLSEPRPQHAHNNQWEPRRGMKAFRCFISDLSLIIHCSVWRNLDAKVATYITDAVYPGHSDRDRQEASRVMKALIVLLYRLLLFG